ncbi:S-adenosyl-L-methionine-dependent methyltransferase [Annulohypoxylon maeteangense]|uniref:S-adenosyl-L-methionine-dependent methyltransferase n=1 Tax=Annulohypoxylon maeteangense TaxID=1927788 RepID=UPI002008516E|nr:S-adenosyl-L-methionine-dependent methyltransferase [Annulohypoxylon maeteangense]KAI0888519.1 S-adenosyl-L-methionine-dependent methyltransferase [Annulohypoxylon maeteangense]
MGSSDEENARLAHPEFWDQRYGQANGDRPTHEWFRTFGDLDSFFNIRLFKNRNPDSKPKILHLGSGDSDVPVGLYERGYKNQLCVDFSSTVVGIMSKRHSSMEGIEWKYADVRRMDDLPDKSVDIAFDKGTLDAMIYGSPWCPPDDVKDNTSQYIREVSRVLKDDGVFLYVTYRQPHFIRPLLNCKGTDWDIELDILGDGTSSFSYHGFVLRKKP